MPSSAVFLHAVLVENSVHVVVVRRGLGASEKSVRAVGGFSRAGGARREWANRGENLVREGHTLIGGPGGDLPED
jgi:hypothetical protein